MRLVRLLIASSVVSAGLLVMPAAAHAAPATTTATPDSLLRVCITVVPLGIPRTCIDTPV